MSRCEVSAFPMHSMSVDEATRTILCYMRTLAADYRSLAATNVKTRYPDWLFAVRV